MRRRRGSESREAALKFYLALGRHLLKTDDLHFGYWTDGLEVDIRNLPRAQENHSEFIISHIPKDTKTILDVGCGVGRMALRLMGLGYQVEGVSPSPFLAAEARRLLGNGFRIFECPFEDLQAEKRYDLVLFSESFQYVGMKKALEKSSTLLTEGGHLLICDYFQTNAEGKSALGGGHRLKRFYEMIGSLPFELVRDVDITEEAAPTMDLADDVLRNVFHPTWKLVLEFLASRWPVPSRLLTWAFRRKIERLERKYFAGARDGKHFKKFKSYRLLLCRKAASSV